MDDCEDECEDECVDGVVDSSTYLGCGEIIAIYRECKARWDASWVQWWNEMWTGRFVAWNRRAKLGGHTMSKCSISNRLVSPQWQPHSLERH